MKRYPLGSPEAMRMEPPLDPPDDDEEGYPPSDAEITRNQLQQRREEQWENQEDHE